MISIVLVSPDQGSIKAASGIDFRAAIASLYFDLWRGHRQNKAIVVEKYSGWRVYRKEREDLHYVGEFLQLCKLNVKEFL